MCIATRLLMVMALWLTALTVSAQQPQTRGTRESRRWKACGSMNRTPPLQIVKLAEALDALITDLRSALT